MKGNSRRNTQRGFTIAQMVTTIAIISIVTVFGVLGIRNARAEFRLQNSARLFATHIERARVDAIRRHAATGDESSIETFGPGSTTYAVSMDWGDGVVETRNFDLESGLSFVTAAKKVSFNWRGRIEQAWVFQIFSGYLERSLPVDVSGSGDITVGEQHFPDQLIPDIWFSLVTNDTNNPTPTPTIEASPTPAIEASPSPEEVASPTPIPSPTATPHGNSDGNNGNGSGGNNGNGNASPTPTPSSSPSPSASPGASPIPQCASALSSSRLDLSQSNTLKQSGSVTFTMTNGTGTVRIISATQAGNGNSVNIALSLLRIDGNGSSIITVSTKHGAGNRGEFIVEVAASPSCGSTQKLTVFVSN